MPMLHNSSIETNTIVPKEGQRELLCSNKKFLRCPSLGYEYIEDSSKVDKAFDILFDAIIKLREEKDDGINQTNSNLC